MSVMEFLLVNLIGISSFTGIFQDGYSRNISRTEPTSQWLLLIHLNKIKRLGMARETCFPNSSSALAFFPHQNMPPLVTFHLNYQLRRILQRDYSYTHQFVFGQEKIWRWILLHHFCIMHEHIFCLPDWGTFSNYHKSGYFHCYKK